jgi:hypothetical protein
MTKRWGIIKEKKKEMEVRVYNQVLKKNKVTSWLKLLLGYKQIKTVCLTFFAKIWKQMRQARE